MTHRKGILEWLRTRLRREPDADLGDELRFHLQMETEALVAAGMSPARAAREARRRFGGVDRYTEELRDVRGSRWIEYAGQDLRYAARLARRFPVFTLAVVATLGVAIGANTAIFSVVDAVLLRPLPYTDPERVVALYSQNPDGSQPRFSVSYADYLDWRAQTRSFTDIAVLAPTSITLIENDQPERLSGLMASGNLFSILGTRPTLGRLFGPADERSDGSDAIILTEAFWRRRFGGDSSIIGRRLQFTGRTRTVVGVVSERQLNGRGLDVITVFNPSAIPGVENHAQHMLSSVARLKDGVSLAQAQQDLAAVAARLAEVHPSIKGWGANVFSATDEQTRTVRRPLLILLVASGIVLLMGCINVANLLITRAATRGREVALRQALGAPRSRLVSQLLAESAVLTAGGGLLGIAIAAAGTRLLLRVAPANTIPRLEDVSVDARMLGFAILLSALTALLVGLWPALGATRSRVEGMLRSGGRTNTGSATAPRMRRTLVVAEISLAMVLLICSGLVIQSLSNMLRIDPGFQVQDVVTMRISPTGGYADSSIVALYRNITSRLAARPGIDGVAGANTPPLSAGGISTPIRLIGRPASQTGQLMSALTAITPNYFRTVGIPLLRGRDIAWSDAGAYLIATEEAARAFWPGENPIGKRVAFGTRDTVGLEVIGVVKDSRARGLTVDPAPMLYISYVGAVSVARTMTLVVRGDGDIGTITSTTRAVLKEIDPRLPVFQVQSLRDIVDQSFAQARLNTLLLTVFAAMAVLLAGIGMYGVISFSVTQRTQEIGVRMALGASRREVLVMVFRETGVLAIVGVLVGLAGALAATRLIQSWLFGIERTDVATLIATSAGILAVAILAGLVPARRATRVDPLLAMRSE
jgi:predicted permease